MPKDEPKYWLSPVKETDDFGDLIDRAVGGVIIDGATHQGPWAIMTPQSWETYGVGVLGLGLGQKYQMQDDGRWLCVEGWSPELT